MASRDIPIFQRPKSGIWYLRRTIPTKLRQHFPNGNGGHKAELSPISLGTRDERAARKAAAIPWAEFQTLLDGLARGRPQLGTAKKFFRELFAQDAALEVEGVANAKARIAELEESIEIAELAAKTATGTGGTAERLREARLKRERAELLELKRAALKGRRELVSVPADLDNPEIAGPILEDYARQFAAEHPQPVNGAARDLLHQVIRSEAIAAYGKIGETINEPVLAQAAAPARLPLHNATELTPPCTVWEYYREVFRKGRKLRLERGDVGISPDGLDKVKEGARDFTDVMGDLHIAAVTSTHVREFRSVLRRIPASWRKRGVNEGKPLRQLVAEADAEEEKTGKAVPRLAPKTIESTLQGIRSLFKFACDEGHLNDSPARGVREELPSERTYDTNFTVADLNKLFASPWFTGAQGGDSLTTLKATGNVLIRDHRYWAFLCMLFSGARVGEIGGIRADQVHIEKDADTDQEWGYFEFDWTPGQHGRRLKNASSVRCVPIHRELIKLGFLDYARRIKEAGHERLFPDWIPTAKVIDAEMGLTKNDYSSSPSMKVFKRYLDWLGIKRRGISPKSFRASWETATVGRNIDERALLKITGRTLSGELPKYVGKKGIAEQLREAVDQVTYDGLEISHLYSK